MAAGAGVAGFNREAATAAVVRLHQLYQGLEALEEQNDAAKIAHLQEILTRVEEFETALGIEDGATFYGTLSEDATLFLEALLEETGCTPLAVLLNIYSTRSWDMDGLVDNYIDVVHPCDHMFGAYIHSSTRFSSTRIGRRFLEMAEEITIGGLDGDEQDHFLVEVLGPLSEKPRFCKSLLEYKRLLLVILSVLSTASAEKISIFELYAENALLAVKNLLKQEEGPDILLAAGNDIVRRLSQVLLLNAAQYPEMNQYREAAFELLLVLEDKRRDLLRAKLVHEMHISPALRTEILTRLQAVVNTADHPSQALATQLQVYLQSVFPAAAAAIAAVPVPVAAGGGEGFGAGGNESGDHADFGAGGAGGVRVKREHNDDAAHSAAPVAKRKSAHGSDDGVVPSSSGKRARTAEGVYNIASAVASCPPTRVKKEESDSEYDCSGGGH